MRIPSQFNDESLYGRRPSQGENLQTQRRLLRLVVGLALVLVVMSKARNPAVYRTFFGEAGQSRPVALQPSSDSDQPHSSTALLPQGDWQTDPQNPQDRKIGHLLTDALLPSDQQQWVVALSRWQNGRGAGMVPSTVEDVLATLEQSEAIDAERKKRWLEMIESFRGSTSGAATALPRQADQAPLAAWLAALDETAAGNVVDGAVWRSGDFQTFYRYLDQAARMPSENVATTGALPLLQQPDVYRTRLVRVGGSVARAERIKAQENAFGVTEYWQLWLRPSDGVERPLVAIVPEVPELVAQVGSQAALREGPQITMVGRFLKRLAYRSEVGADLAPVVVGRLLTVPMTEAEMAASVGSAQGQSDSRRLMATMVVAALLGLSVAALAMWRTAVTAKRSRQLRVSHRQPSEEFLRGLDDQLPDSDPASAQD